jgi:hypothetical protein
MSLLFLAYGIAFILLIRKQQKKAYFFFILATVASLAMFSYHTTSTLNLNF